MSKYLIASIMLIISAASNAGLYPTTWTSEEEVEYLRIASTGDGVRGDLDTTDLVFVKLKAPVINPRGCASNDKYVFIPPQANTKESLMYSTLLAAAMAGKKVSLSISQTHCDYGYPTIYDVKVNF